MKLSIDALRNKKNNRVPITMLTAYDFPTAQIEDAAGVDAILVGDSVGTNVLGYTSERDVTMEDMLHHTAAVCRGVLRAFVLVDLPFLAAGTPESACSNGLRLLEAGAQCVKLEGWREQAPVVERMAHSGIPVCGHIGYNPQIHGPRPTMFGKTTDEALALLETGRILQESGASLMILEKVTDEAAGMIAHELALPVIGIGSGRGCDGQVLVIHDLLGITLRRFRHARRYAELRQTMVDAVASYIADVEHRQFPGPEHSSARTPPPET